MVEAAPKWGGSKCRHWPSSARVASISLSGDAEEELTGYWEKLSADGKVFEPLSKAPWGDSFGMCADKFGVTWLVNISGGQSAA